MMTDAERVMVETVEEEQADFYAPLMALCLARFRDEVRRNAPFENYEIATLVMQAYEDLEKRA
jgi:hypothetical protein